MRKITFGKGIGVRGLKGRGGRTRMNKARGGETRGKAVEGERRGRGDLQTNGSESHEATAIELNLKPPGPGSCQARSARTSLTVACRSI